MATRVDNTLWGEDMLFSRRLREMGMPMFIYPNIHFGHFGMKVWGGNFHQFLQSQKTKGPGERTPVFAVPKSVDENRAKENEKQVITTKAA